jgi:hypothetical protein
VGSAPGTFRGERTLRGDDAAGKLQLTALLRVMVLRGAPPADLELRMSAQHSLVMEEGARLRDRLPAYLARRRALLAKHTSLIAPLQALVSSCVSPRLPRSFGPWGSVLLPLDMRWAPKS